MRNHSEAAVFSNSTKGQYDRAIQDYDQAIRLIPNNSLAFSLRGGAYHGKGPYDRAIRDYHEAIRPRPSRPSYSFNERCWTKIFAGRARDALADCEQALSLSPDVPAFLDSRALAFFVLSDLERALAEYDDAIRRVDFASAR